MPKTRAGAIARAKAALREYVIDGIKTNIPLHLKILDDPDFIAGELRDRLSDAATSTWPRPRAPLEDKPKTHRRSGADRVHICPRHGFQ